MADIQVPQTNPNAPQVVNPFPIVDSYLNRQQNQQKLNNDAILNLGNTYNELRQQKLQNAMNLLAAKTTAIRQVGPDYANQIYGGINPNSGMPDQPNAASPVPMGVGGGTGNQGAPPAQAQPSVLNDPAIIQHAQSIGHPAYATGTYQPPQPQQDSNGLLDNSQKIATLRNQIPGYLNQGELGKEKIQEIMSQIQALSEEQKATNEPKQFSIGQAAEEDRFQRGQANKVNEAVAGEVSKQRQKSTATDTAQLALNDFAKTFISKDANGNHIDLTNPSSLPFVAGLKAKVSQATSGRVGGEAGGEMLNKSKTLGNTLVGILTSGGRMSPAVAEDFVRGIIPPPDAPTPLKIKRLDDIQRLISTVKNGDKNALDTVIATLTGSKGSAIQR